MGAISTILLLFPICLCLLLYSCYVNYFLFTTLGTYTTSGCISPAVVTRCVALLKRYLLRYVLVTTPVSLLCLFRMHIRGLKLCQKYNAHDS